MPSASDLKPKQEIRHPYSGQSVTVKEVRAVKGGRLRVYFRGYGVWGSFTVKPDHHIELAPERSQRGNT
jgi:hypothetical protein